MSDHIIKILPQGRTIEVDSKENLLISLASDSGQY